MALTPQPQPVEKFGTLSITNANNLKLALFLF